MKYDESSLTALISPFVNETGGLMRALRAVQAEFGFIPPDSLQPIAKLFNLTQAEVRGVVTFYDDFHMEKVPDTVVRVCQAEACQSVGSRDLTKQVAKLLGVKGLHEKSANGAVGLEAVYCLGLCSVGPSMMVNGKLVGRAVGDRVEKALAGAIDEARS